MRDFSKRRGRAREFLRSLVAMAGAMILAVVAIVALRAAWNMYEKFAEAGVAREAAEGELEKLQRREEEVKATVVRLSSERGIEAAVRERFGVARPSEGEIRIVRDESAQEDVSEKKTFWQQLFDIFFLRI